MALLLRSAFGWAVFAAIAGAPWFTGAAVPALYGMLALCAVFVALRPGRRG